jgi:hypothetical protein
MPHGAALGVTNRYTIFLLPGGYIHASDVFTFGTNFIDIKGLGAPEAVALAYQSNLNAGRETTGFGELAGNAKAGGGTE